MVWPPSRIPTYRQAYIVCPVSDWGANSSTCTGRAHRLHTIDRLRKFWSHTTTKPPQVLFMCVQQISYPPLLLCLFRSIFTPSPSTSPSLLPFLLYNNTKSITLVSFLPSGHLRTCCSHSPAILPCHVMSSSTTSPYVSYGRWLIRAFLSWGTRRSRLLDKTIASGIHACTKPHMLEYYRFILNMSSVANILYATKDSTPGIPYAEYNMIVRVCVIFRQAWKYLSLLYFSAFSSAFSGIMCR